MVPVARPDPAARPNLVSHAGTRVRLRCRGRSPRGGRGAVVPARPRRAPAGCRGCGPGARKAPGRTCRAPAREAVRAPGGPAPGGAPVGGQRSRKRSIASTAPPASSSSAFTRMMARVSSLKSRSRRPRRASRWRLRSSASTLPRVICGCSMRRAASSRRPRSASARARTSPTGKRRSASSHTWTASRSSFATS